MKKEDYTDKATGQLVNIVEDGVPLLAFVPDPLPRKMNLSGSLQRLNEQASMQLGRLFGAAEILNPVLQLFLRREAIASNAIEGTIVAARELYLFENEENEKKKHEAGSDRFEVYNYINAMQRGAELLLSRPISLNMINELHEILLYSVRGQDKMPGQIRKRQNAISSTRQFIDARYIPPPASEIMAGISDMEKFINEEVEIPDLIRAALFHYQFEAIHPYLDGNGRLGRLLIPLLLCSWEKLPEGIPRLYLSKYLEENNGEYRDRLLRVSQNGEWNEWIEFFLKAIISESNKTYDKAHELRNLRDNYIDKVKGGPGNLQEIIRKLFDNPVIKIKNIVDITNVSRAQATNYARKLVELDILKRDDNSWGASYYATGILKLFFEEN